MNKTIKQNGVELPVITEQTIGRKGAAGKSYYSLDFAALIDYATSADGKKTEDTAKTGANIAGFFKGFESAIAFIQSDFNKAMVSLQVNTPANSKTGKTLSDEEKFAAMLAYVETINEETRRRSGKASELKRMIKAQSDLMKNFNPATDTAKLVELATAIAKMQSEIDAEKDSE